MVLARTLIFLLLLSAIVLFGFFAFTGQQRYKHYGLLILKWVLISGFAFFAVLIAQRLG